MSGISFSSGFSKVAVQTDKICDYIPVVSTVTNLVDIFETCVCKCFKSNSTISQNRYFSYIQNKPFWRSAVLLIPVLGNIAIGIYDFKRYTKAKKVIEETKGAFKNSIEALENATKALENATEALENAMVALDRATEALDKATEKNNEEHLKTAKEAVKEAEEGFQKTAKLYEEKRKLQPYKDNLHEMKLRIEQHGLLNLLPKECLFQRTENTFQVVEEKFEKVGAMRQRFNKSLQKIKSKVDT